MKAVLLSMTITSVTYTIAACVTKAVSGCHWGVVILATTTAAVIVANARSRRNEIMCNLLAERTK